VFLTYCTNAVLARKEVPALQIVSLPEPLAVGADYGLIVRKDAPDAAWRLALFVLAPEGQGILADYGFTSGALPRKE
jgi:ABC-type molybdate transport system substrate-binding protein